MVNDSFSFNGNSGSGVGELPRLLKKYTKQDNIIEFRFIVIGVSEYLIYLFSIQNFGGATGAKDKYAPMPIAIFQK